MKKFLNLILLGILIFSSLFFVCKKPARAESLIIQPSSADARVEEKYGGNNFGDRVDLKIRSKNLENKRIFIKFDLSSIPVGATINEARLQLYLTDAPGNSRYYDIFRVLEDWGELTIVWNSQANVSSTPTDTISYGGRGVPINVWLSWNVTSDVTYFYNNPAQNFGWLIKDQEENGTRGREAIFCSNNYSVDSLRPKLTIDYTINQPSPGPVCGNNLCETGENSTNCPADCPIQPVCGNDICEAGENYQNCPTDCPRQFQQSDIVINEFVADPSDDETEWIELYNKTSSEIDLTGWTIEDGTAKPKNLDGLTIPAGDFLVLEKGKNFSFALNNSGDIIILRYQSIIIDQVSYGDWDDGNKEDNAPTTNDPNSIARIDDGYDTDQDSADFKVSTTPTKGRPNQILNSEEKIYPSGVIINELLPNPQGDDSENEFIELKNLTDQEIDLEGWKIEDAAGIKFVISSQKLTNTKISAKGFFVLWRKDSKIALNNSGTEILKLYQPNNNLVDFVQYSGTVQDDHSYSFDGSNNWFWSTQATPGQENVIIKINQKPKAVISAPNKALLGEEIIFDASDSYDLDGDVLTYVWDFGDGTRKSEILVKHTYKKAGKYNIKLEVKDIFGVADTAKTTIEILSGEKINLLSSLEAEILITEFLPNPKGSDEQEWIEIYNAGAKEINLDGWFLDDIDGGSKPYKIKEKTILPGEYLVFYRQETKIVLNNTFDSVQLLDSEGNLFSEIYYEKSKEGFSYALDENGDWHWTSILTPGQANLFSSNEPTSKKSSVKTAAEQEEVLEIQLSEIRNQDIGDWIKVQGIVSVEPGVLGSQIFYLAGSGIQVYFYKKDFPELKVGDRVEVIGELAEYKNETRIKIAQKSDIRLIERNQEVKIHRIKIEEIDENLEGGLVMVEGQLIESTGNYLYLDDGTDEIKVYLKTTTGIKKPKMKEGDLIKITGIVSQNNNEYRLLPRFQEDIEIIKKEETEKSKETAGVLVEALGSLSGKNNLFGKINNLENTKYLLVSALALLLILVGLLIKKKK